METARHRVQRIELVRMLMEGKPVPYTMRGLGLLEKHYIKAAPSTSGVNGYVVTAKGLAFIKEEK